VPVADAEVDVLIVGGGPVGLTARALLERWGVRIKLVEKYSKLSPFPRSRLINVRSMEIFHQLGVAADVRALAFAPEFGCVRFRDNLIGHEYATAAMIGLDAPIAESPVFGAISSQDRLEPILRAAAATTPLFGVELVDLAEENGAVVVELVDKNAGTRSCVRARYVIGADGANSIVRQRLGIDTTGPGTIGHSTTVVFDADLQRWSAEQPAGVYFTTNGSFLPLYPEGGWSWVVSTPDDTTNVDWAARVSEALGPDHDIRADVLRVEHWVVNAFVAERFRHGRILLAGDAAHALPPAGGFGMNLGIADVHNLCWKLAGVLHGWANPRLLETYETERQPVAHETLGQAVANAQLMWQVQAKCPADNTEVELPWSERYFAQLGLVLGAAYHSRAVVTDGAPVARAGVGTDYVPTCEPGHRMPHLWLSPGRSTLDTLGEWFTVLTPDPGRWDQQALWPLHIETLSSEHADHWNLGPGGALLVRPDGYVGARLSGDAALDQALATITGLR
jgi:putative polyketide hydroxylase